MTSETTQPRFQSQEEKEAYIAARIEESRRKKAARKFYYCPACKGAVSTRQRFMAHLKKCCKDLLSHHKLTQIDDNDKFAEFLTAITQKETSLKSRALYLRYLDPSRERRRTVQEVAAVMGLPLERTERMIKMASKEIPLARDDIPVEVLYEDASLLAVQKPPFITTSPKHRFLGGTLFSRVFGYLGSEPYGLHRLDMNTSGVVVFAKDAQRAEAVNVQFRNKTVRKAYMAICTGTPDETHFVVESYIDSDPEHEVARQVTADDGKWSTTSFEVLDTNPEFRITSSSLTQNESGIPQNSTGVCLLKCIPLTGRTHQIRLHAAHKGHGIIGDEIYGSEGPWIDRQALHAFEIEFKHPVSEEDITIQAPPPEDFQKALEALRLEIPEHVMSLS